MFKMNNDWTKWLMLAPEGQGGGSTGSDEGGASGGTGGGQGEGGNPSSEGASGDKTFTQDQVNSMIAADKRKTTSSIYKSLGFESEEQAKEFIEKYKQQEEDNKSDLAKAQEKAQQLEAEKRAETLKAQDLQYKFDAMAAGCSAESANDVVVLAKAKVDDNKDFAAALEGVKKQYPAMFGQTDNPGESTGSGGTSPRKKVSGGDIAGIGKRLAEQRKQNDSTTKDGGFFK